MLIIILFCQFYPGFAQLLAGDSIKVDSFKTEIADSVRVSGDSIPVSSIPEVIGFRTTSELDRVLYTLKEIKPDSYELSAADLFFTTPYIIANHGHSIFIVPIRHIGIFLNGHSLTNPLFGNYDLGQLPFQFFEKIEIRREDSGTRITACDLISKINHYEKPYSYLSFTSLGFNTIYNIDFTRSLTSYSGFYLSGLSSNLWVSRDSLYAKNNGFYAHIYYHRFIPLRLDLNLSSRTYGSKRREGLIDYSLIFGNKSHRIMLYHKLNTFLTIDTADAISTAERLKSYGLGTSSYYNPGFVEIFFGFNSALDNLKTDNYGTHTLKSANLWQKFNKSYKNLVGSVANQISVYDMSRFYTKPQFVIGYDILDSTYLYFSAGQSMREPTVSERYGTDMAESGCWLRANPDLDAEYSWTSEIGIKSKNLFFNCYKIDYQNFIGVVIDTNGYKTPRNISSRSLTGMENFLELPLSKTISLGHSGNYLLKLDSLLMLPKISSNFFIGLKKRTAQADFSLILKGQYLGERPGMAGQRLHSYWLFSAIGTIKFITLSSTLRFDNILDKKVPDNNISPRNTSLILKWEFWD